MKHSILFVSIFLLRQNSYTATNEFCYILYFDMHQMWNTKKTQRCTVMLNIHGPLETIGRRILCLLLDYPNLPLMPMTRRTSYGNYKNWKTEWHYYSRACAGHYLYRYIPICITKQYIYKTKSVLHYLRTYTNINIGIESKYMCKGHLNMTAFTKPG